MKKSFVLMALILPITAVFGFQGSGNEIAKTINRQVWEPFRESYQNLDAALFNSLHTDDVKRITGNGIRIGEEYRQSNRMSFERSKQSGAKRTIEFSFISRIATGNHAYETGYYKIRREDSDNVFYGYFHVLLIKENDLWKIAEDWDTDQLKGKPITEADFNSGKSEYSYN